MPFVPLAAMGALVFTIINFLKMLTNKQWSPVLTQIISWGAGVVVVMLFANTDWADTVSFGGVPLSQLNGWSQFVIGLMAASIFGVVKEITKAIDSSDSAAKPPLLPPAA
jgi:hypothetical protein